MNDTFSCKMGPSDKATFTMALSTIRLEPSSGSMGSYGSQDPPKATEGSKDPPVSVANSTVKDNVYSPTCELV